MRKLGIFFIIFLSLTFFNFNEKVEAAAIPISENELDEHDIERFINEAKVGLYELGLEVNCNIYGEKFYKDKGVLYWTANFGQNKNSFIRFKLNKKNTLIGLQLLDICRNRQKIHFKNTVWNQKQHFKKFM